MIFKKLILKNFMSYSNAEVDLSGIHVACLIGANGAGKSSLLDAITWTIWEEGRARTDELVKLGTDEMSCEVDFYMEDNLYKIYRSRNKGLKNSQGKSNLEFQIFNPKDQTWKPLTLSSTRQTQELIIKTIKMDYPTFVNSVYLKQGKADEFTVKRPNERKQILADILGLEVYDKLCEVAKEGTREIEQGISLEQNLIVSLNEKIQKEGEVRTLFDSVFAQVSGIDIELNKIKNLLNAKEKELNEKREKEKQIQTLEKSKQNQESLIKILEEQLKNTKEKETKCKELIDNKSKILKEHGEYVRLKEEYEITEKKRDEFNKFTLEKAHLEQELKEKISKTEQDLAVYKSKLKDRSSSKDKLDEKLKNENKFKDFLVRAENEINNFKKSQEFLAKVETEGLELKHQKELLSLEFKKISEDRNEIKNKIKTLSEHGHADPCPLCKSPINDKSKVIELYNSEILALNECESLLNEKLNSLEEKLVKKRKEHSEVKERINNFGKVVISILPELREIKQEEVNLKVLEKENSVEIVSFLSSQLEVSKSEFQKTREQVVLLDKEISSFQNEILSLNTFLSSGTLIKEAVGKINKVKNEIENLKYSSESYDLLRTALKEKESIVTLYGSLNNAESEILAIQKEVETLTVKISVGRSELNELDALIKANKNQVQDIDTLMKEVNELRQKEFNETEKLNENKKQLILLEQTLEEIQNSKKLLEEKECKIKDFLDKKKDLETLERAFSKNGIQVAIIETIVPEIEKEANRILSRLTENQMHVALKTKREKKSSSGMTETLDVVIADDAGTRNYELYSGGEAFKINFALRLALSRLLANRAGAKLQTLIIDEGFGSQDDAGKERLIEVIKSIENEFELILVVTHLDELKEAFSSQILVTKDEKGSKVRLVA